MQSQTVKFWNGNKSPARQRYELDILQSVLDDINFEGNIDDDRTDYPSAEDEGNIFNTGADILVTVLGNPKFDGRKKVVINTPLANGMLGKRLLIIRHADQSSFASIRTDTEMKIKVSGIPETWADADLFRANGYCVAEKGSLADIFIRLANNECDYVSLGTLEVEEIYSTLAAKESDLCMESSLMLQYPMPLVFYVNPARRELAGRVKQGLCSIHANGILDRIFNQHFGELVTRLHLDKRIIFHMHNPMLPDQLP